MFPACGEAGERPLEFDYEVPSAEPMRYRLRDGSKTSDRRLARLVQFDERSRGYPVRNLVTKKTPRSYLWACDQHLDQGQEGACVGASMAHELIARPCAITGLNMKFAREKIYWEAQKIDEYKGGEFPGAKPQSDGTSVLAGVKVLQRLGYISEYRWAFGLSDLVLAVGYMGPAILGLNWYEGMFDTFPCGHIHVHGKLSGGHAILCKGVDVRTRSFILHNSWGKGWGRGGDALVTWEEMDRLLRENGEAVVPVLRRRPRGV